MMIGPDKNGSFKPVLVKGIHENMVDVDSASKGQTICVAIKSVNKKDLVLKTKSFRKGMSLISVNKNYNVTKKGTNPIEQLCVREFDAEV